jgi:uncharacterized protein (UPF0303 family)
VAPTPRTAGVPRDDAWRRCGEQVAVPGLPQLENHAFVVRVLSAFLEVDL